MDADLETLVAWLVGAAMIYILTRIIFRRHND